MNKKYALHNSYFKKSRNFSLNLPDTILEIAKYQIEHNKLPFNYYGNNWVYDAFCERQKYHGVFLDQFLTPDETVDRMLHFAGKYFTQDNNVLEPFCGTGQITKELLKDRYSVTAFDIDDELVSICKLLYPNLIVNQCDFRDFDTGIYNQIIANPPYNSKDLQDFLVWLLDRQTTGGISVLLLPNGFILKKKPKALLQIIQQFSVLEKEQINEKFERTGTNAEIVVLRKL
jgi:SAM-dependent methyltransferase